MILSIFERVGDRFTAAEAYQGLMSRWANDPFARNKAAGSLGGAVHGGTILLDENGYYERMR